MATQQIKDILGAEVPQPSFVLRPSVAAPLPSGVTLRRANVDDPSPTARTLDPVSRTYKAKGDDVPRIYGRGQRLLVETATSQNFIPDSANPYPPNSLWNSLGIGTFSKPSIIDGKTAREISSTTDGSDAIQNFNIGSFSSGDEVVNPIFEEFDSPKVRVELVDTTAGSIEWAVDLDFSNLSANLQSGAVDDITPRKIADRGPAANNPVVELNVSYSSQTSGNSRKIKIKPDPTGGQNSTVLHHAQLTHSFTRKAPIVTDGSPTKRAGDTVRLFKDGQPSWWNPEEGTIIFSGVSLAPNRDFGHRLVATGANETHLNYNTGSDFSYFDGSNFVGTSATVDPFVPFTAGVSIKENKVAVGTKEDVIEGNHNGTLLTVQDLRVGGDNKSTFLCGEVLYFPEALPATPADRSVGDPVSLQTLV